MDKKGSGKGRKITVATETRKAGKVRQTADYLIGIGRSAVSKVRASAIAWIASKKPQARTSGPPLKVRHKTRRPKMAHKTARKGRSKR